MAGAAEETAVQILGRAKTDRALGKGAFTGSNSANERKLPPAFVNRSGSNQFDRGPGRI